MRGSSSSTWHKGRGRSVSKSIPPATSPLETFFSAAVISLPASMDARSRWLISATQSKSRCLLKAMAASVLVSKGAKSLANSTGAVDSERLLPGTVNTRCSMHVTSRPCTASPHLLLSTAIRPGSPAASLNALSSRSQAVNTLRHSLKFHMRAYFSSCFRPFVDCASKASTRFSSSESAARCKACNCSCCCCSNCCWDSWGCSCCVGGCDDDCDCAAPWEACG